jgi:hypothetical protein
MDYFDSLEAAVTISHKCASNHRATVFVHERTEYGLTVWKGNVEVFDLIGHPAAETCYAWNYIEGNTSKIFTIAGNALIDSAQKAVQAMICMEQQPVQLNPPLANGLKLLKEQLEQGRKIIFQTEIRSEELIASLETLTNNHSEIRRRNRRAQPALFKPQNP